MQYIIEFFQTLFRMGPDRPDVWIYDWTDWLAVIAMGLAVHQTVSLYEKTDSKPKMKRFLLVILGLHLVSRYIITQPYYDYGERMPFYSCTLAAVILFVMNIRPPKKRWQHDLMDWAAFAGIYGGVLAIGFSSPGVYLAPHITGVDYFIGHAMIIIFGLIRIMDRDKLFSARELKSSTLITVIYMLISVVINHFAGTNYAFLSRPPEDNPLLSKLPGPLYSIGTFAAYILANGLVLYLANRALARRRAPEGGNAEEKKDNADANRECYG